MGSRHPYRRALYRQALLGLSALAALSPPRAHAQPCYANCDSSTQDPVLNVQDFGCFLNRFANGDSRANCDNSTTPPVLNVQDFACFLNAFAAGCPSPMVNGQRARDILRAASTQRVLLVRLGDSNQLKGGWGWDEGFQYAAAARYGIFSTPLISCNENENAGAGIGYRCAFISQGSPVGAMAGPTQSWTDYLNFPIPDLVVHRLCYVQSTLAATTNTGLNLDADWPGDVNANLRYSIWVGRFTTAGGSFQPGWRRADAPPFPVIQVHTLWPTGPDPVESMTRLDDDLPAATRNYALNPRPTLPGQADITGPFLATYQCVTNRDRLTGIGSHTFFSGGGKSLYDYANELLNTPDRSIAHFFDCARQTVTMVGQDPKLIILIDSGLNDRVANVPSLGPNPVGSLLPWGYTDNLRAIINRLTPILLNDGWQRSQFEFVCSVSHPVDPDPLSQPEFPLTCYREYLEAMAAADGDLASLNLNRLTSCAEILARNWYFPDGSHSHLTEPAYREFAGRELDAIAR